MTTADRKPDATPAPQVSGNKAALTVTQATGALDDLSIQANVLLRELGEAS